MSTRIRPPLFLVALLNGTLVLGACDDRPDPLTPQPPDPRPDVSTDVAIVRFAEADLQLGGDEVRTVTVANDGDATLSVTSTTVAGTHPADFTIEDGGGSFELAPGATRALSIRFTPGMVGARNAVLAVSSNDPDEPTANVALTGTGAVFRFTQVDRKGIPGLNTVFNHPTSVPGFDKRAYNIAGPADDLASYRGLFETVLGAVANADPAGTAALLLPDELPVSLGAPVSAFGMLTGRDLADDAVDVALTVVVGVPGLQSDHVDANDVPFLGQFPYLAPPN